MTNDRWRRNSLAKSFWRLKDAGFIPHVGVYKRLNGVCSALYDHGLDLLFIKVFDQFIQKIPLLDPHEQKVLMFLMPKNVVHDRLLLTIKKMEFVIQLQEPVDHNPNGITARPVANIELRIIKLSSLCSDQDRIFFSAPFMIELTRMFITDPF